MMKKIKTEKTLEIAKSVLGLICLGVGLAILALILNYLQGTI